ncbi:hypothetical protein [Streptomyces daliensis]
MEPDPDPGQEPELDPELWELAVVRAKLTGEDPRRAYDVLTGAGRGLPPRDGRAYDGQPSNGQAGGEREEEREREPGPGSDDPCPETGDAGGGPRPRALRAVPTDPDSPRSPGTAARAPGPATGA